MANEQNLIPFDKRTENEQREYAKKGGQKSGEVRRKRKAIKEQMNMLLSLPFNLKDNNGNDIADMLSTLGIDKESIDNQMAMVISLWKTAISDSNQKIQAIQEIRKIIQDEENIKNQERVQIINELPNEEEEDGNY